MSSIRLDNNTLNSTTSGFSTNTSLSVTGNLSATGNLNTTGNITTNGSISASSISASNINISTINGLVPLGETVSETVNVPLLSVSNGYKIESNNGNFYKLNLIKSLEPYSELIDSSNFEYQVQAPFSFSSVLFAAGTNADKTRLYLGGSFSLTSGSTTFGNGIGAFKQDGTPDTTFNVGAGTNDYVYTLQVQPDDKVIIAGDFTSYSGFSINRISRLNTDGTLDTSFNVGAGANSPVFTTAIQSDGKIIIGGVFTSYSGSLRSKIVRINTDGTVDSTFNTGHGFSNVNSNSHTVYGLVEISGSFFVVGENLTHYSGSSVLLTKTSNTGTFLSEVASQSTNDIILTITVQPTDGKLIVGGVFNSISGSGPNFAKLNAQDFTPEVGFNTGTGPNFTTYSTSRQVDGKIIIGGSFTSYSGSSINRIARLNTDGTLDTSFNVGTGASSLVLTTSTQSDGKIIIGGFFSSYSGSSINSIARLNTDGTRDTSFNVGTGANAQIETIALQSDGKIIIGGNFSSYSGSSINRIARLNTDGTRDTSFNVGTGASSLVLTTSTQSDGKIIIGGVFTSYSGSSINRIARLNTDGTLDTSFNVGTGANSEVRTTSTQSDGKIIIGGFFSSYSGSSVSGIARINTDGTLDTTYSSSLILVRTVAVSGSQNDVLIGGTFIKDALPVRSSIPNPNFSTLVKINSDGTLDTSFTSSIQPASLSRFVELTKDGKILINNPNGGILRLNADGTIDNSFVTASIAYSYSNPAKIAKELPDGGIIVGGFYRITSYAPPGGGTSTIFNNIVFIKLKKDGTLDPSFKIYNNDYVSFIEPRGLGTLVIEDNKILLYGQFMEYGNIRTNGFVLVNNNGLVRSENITTKHSIGNSGGKQYLLKNNFSKNNIRSMTLGDQYLLIRTDSSAFQKILLDGSQDTTFPTLTVNNTLRSVVIQKDQKILLGGNFSSISGSSINNFVRLNSNGTIDNTFKIGSGFNNDIYSIALQSDDKILVGGLHTAYSGSAAYSVTRLNTDGTLDTSYQGGNTQTVINYIATLSNDKAIIAGNFSSYSGSSVNRIARLNTNGTIDTSFNVGTGLSVFPLMIVVQKDDKVLVVTSGGGNIYSGSVVDDVFRINTDGTLDTSFQYEKPFFTPISIRLLTLIENEEIITSNGYDVAVFNTSGSLLRSTLNLSNFYSSPGAQSISHIAARDGKIYIGGNFQKSKDVLRNKFDILDLETLSNSTNTGSLFFSPTKKYLGEIKAIGTTTVNSDLIKFDNTFTVITGSLVSQSLNKSGMYTDYTASVSVTSGSLFVDLENIKGYDGINYAIEITEF
jgi:uncharacterized delta-60 repeat protein